MPQPIREVMERIIGTALGRSGVTETSNVTDRMSVEDAVHLAIQRVNDAMIQTKPVYVAGTLPGGHDSVTACFIASKATKCDTMFHIDTGVGLQATEQFIQRLCQTMGWPLKVYKALENVRADGTPDPQDYFAAIEQHGFPGPAMHYRMYQRLKERQIERFCRDHKRWRSRDVIMLVSGCRAQESSRRMRIIKGPIDRRGRVVWCNPLYDFSRLDCQRIMAWASVPRSPVVDAIHKSGECLCGAFAKPGELEDTTFWFSDDPTIVRLKEADQRLKEKFGWGWGGPPKQRKPSKPVGPMCTKCEPGAEVRLHDFIANHGVIPRSDAQRRESTKNRE